MVKFHYRLLIVVFLVETISATGQQLKQPGVNLGSALQFEMTFHQQSVALLGLVEARSSGSVIVDKLDFAFLTTEGVFGFAVQGVEGQGQHKLLTVSDRSSNQGIFKNQFGWPFAPSLCVVVPGSLAQLQEMVETEALTVEADKQLYNSTEFQSWNNWPECEKIKISLNRSRFPDNVVWELNHFSVLPSKHRVPTEISLFINSGNSNTLINIATWYISNPRPIHSSALSAAIFTEGIIPAKLSGPKRWKFTKVLNLSAGKLCSPTLQAHERSLAGISANLLLSHEEPRRTFTWIPRYWPLFIGGLLLAGTIFFSLRRKNRIRQ